MLQAAKQATPARALPFVIELDGANRPDGRESLLRLFREDERLDPCLYQHGAILFRGFQVGEAEVFGQVMADLKRETLDYVDGNSPRTKVGAGVYTSTEYPASYFISLHNELSYSGSWPRRLFFCCVQAPPEGGETPLVDSRGLLKALPAPLLERFRSRGVRYVRHMHGGKGFGPSWQKTFQTEARSDIEHYARASGMTLEWLAEGAVRLSSVRPATALHPLTGEEVWFNQADQFHPSTHPRAIYESMLVLYQGREELFPQNAFFGDGGKIPIEDLAAIRETTRAQMTRFPWRPGDFLMVDNMLVAHGRMPFKGDRKVLVAMTGQ